MNDHKNESRGSATPSKAPSAAKGPDEAPPPPENKGKKDSGTSQPSSSKKGGKKGTDPAGDGQTNNSSGKNRGSSNPPKRKQAAKRPAKKRSNGNHQTTNSPRTGARPGGKPTPTLRQPPVDRGELESKAWELYSADINEEGTSMFNEEEAEDLVRRSFILADIFLRFRDQLYGTGSAQGNQDPAKDSEPPQ